ncbi:hypothetical protein [Gallibacterium anatis]|uniref:hypothetical protein n=1 Tax=Gallibacterium anatis TaxID=750 RepID=UPI001B31A291|nr:hypothetical protein [Gallibacterium anatis]MBP4134130.1 hypothetical protein [Gallibacterium anatis]
MMKKAEETEELDSQFIYLWIAFNAAYAKEIKNLENKERLNLNEFLLRICGLDENKVIYDLCSDPLNQQSLIGFFAKTGGNP